MRQVTSPLAGKVARSAGWGHPMTQRPPSHALDRVPLAARRFELASQKVCSLALVGDELFDPRRHSVLDPADLLPDLRAYTGLI